MVSGSPAPEALLSSRPHRERTRRRAKVARHRRAITRPSGPVLSLALARSNPATSSVVRAPFIFILSLCMPLVLTPAATAQMLPPPTDRKRRGRPDRPGFDVISCGGGGR